MLYRIREINGGLLDGMLYKNKESVEKLLEELESSKSYEIEEIPYYIKPGVSLSRAIRTLSERMFEYENGRCTTIDYSDILEEDTLR